MSTPCSQFLSCIPKMVDHKSKGSSPGVFQLIILKQCQGSLQLYSLRDLTTSAWNTVAILRCNTPQSLSFPLSSLPVHHFHDPLDVHLISLLLCNNDPVTDSIKHSAQALVSVYSLQLITLLYTEDGRSYVQGQQSWSPCQLIECQGALQCTP